MDPKHLKEISLFQGLSRKDLQHLGQWTDEVDVPEGKILAEEGAFAYEFVVIINGTADVRQGGEHIRTLDSGDFFGEIGLIESERRTASVVATSPMRLIVITGRDFGSMRSEMPHIAEEIQKKVDERLARDRGE